MTRGDQRDRDRAKNLAKATAAKGKKTGDPAKRREADAKALQDNLIIWLLYPVRLAKAAKDAAGGGGDDKGKKK